MDVLQTREAHPSLFRRLILWGAAGVILAAVAAAGVVADRMARKAEENQTRLLHEVAGVVARMEAGRRAPIAHTMDQRAFAEAYLDPQGVTPAGEVLLVHTLDEGGVTLRVALDEALPDGDHTIEIDGEAWCVHTQTLTTGRHVAVAQQLSEVERIERDAVMQAVVPVILGAIAILILGAVVIRRTSRPVLALADSIGRREPDSADPLSADGVPSEVMPLVESVNDLLARVEVLRAREARFAADAAHELRTPLTALKLEAESLVRSGFKDPEAAKASDAAMERGIERLGRLVDQLLTLQRAQLGRNAQANVPEADLLEALGEAVSLVWEEAEGKAIDFEAVGFDALEDAPVKFPVTPEALTGLLRNLIENAVRYSPRGGEVRVRLVSLSPFVMEVADRGPGIPEELLSRVMDPFFRVPGTGVSGTGLGLAIVRETAAQAGLGVTLTNTHPGLTVRLAAADAAGTEPSEKSKNPESSGADGAS